MKSRALIIVVFAAIVAAVIFRQTKEDSKVAPSEASVVQEAEEVTGGPETSQESALTKISPDTLPSPSLSASPLPGNPSNGSAQETKIADSLPNLENYREEVESNPHDTPKSIVSLSLMLMEKSNRAMESESEAKEFFTELEDCMAPSRVSETPDSALALCLRHAKKVGERYNSLGTRLRTLERNAPEKVKDILSVL